MGEKKVSKNERRFKEFRDIVETFILPLLNKKRDDITPLYGRQNDVGDLIIGKTSIDKNGIERKTVEIYPCKESPYCCLIIGVHSYSRKIVRWANVILREIMCVSHYKYSTSEEKAKQYYGFKDNSKIQTYKDNTYKLAYELGMCRSITKSNQESTLLYSIVSNIKDWSLKTYEGERVPFGIIVDFDADANNNADYLKFLKNTHSAVFTDGIFAGVCLDKKGLVIEYFSTIENQVTEVEPKPYSEELIKNQKAKSVFTPFQYQEFGKRCFGNRIGIISLVNGEILIIKGKELIFAKRGDIWVPFAWENFLEILYPIMAEINSTIEPKDNMMFLRELYCTLLDVSFSHTGGCVSIVFPDNVKNINEFVTDKFSDYNEGRLEKDKETSEKIKMVLQFIKGKNNEVPVFHQLCRKLRQEIISLDGAMVLDSKGEIISVGSIIKIQGGSSGGGRTAAAKHLAKLGIGIKISEDGYIRAYRLNDDTQAVVLKRKIIRLFSIK